MYFLYSKSLNFKKPLLFRSFTVLQIFEFDTICSEIELRYQEYEKKRLSKKRSIRNIGAGNHSTLR